MTKLVGVEIAIGAANTVYNGGLIRCFNNSASVGVLVLANTGGTISNTSVGPYGEIKIRKKSTDTVQGTNFLATLTVYGD